MDNKMVADMQAALELIKKLQAENAKLKVTKGASIKVSAKGAISVYGLGRFPVTLYRSQWEKLFAKIEEIKAFILANEDKLTTKEDSLLAREEANAETE